MREFHATMTSDGKHKKVFSEIRTIGFMNNENLRGHLARAALPKLDEVIDLNQAEKEDFLDFNFAVV